MVEEDSEAPMMAWTDDWLEQVLPKVLFCPFIKPITARVEGSVKPQLSNTL